MTKRQIEKVVTTNRMLRTRAQNMSFEEFDRSLDGYEYREITFFNGPTIREFWILAKFGTEAKVALKDQFNAVTHLVY